MSGGVDSSTAAYILQSAGHEVVGLSMQMYDNLTNADTTYGGCCTIDDLTDAKRVAWKLGIPHFTLNLEGDFHERAQAWNRVLEVAEDSLELCPAGEQWQWYRGRLFHLRGKALLQTGEADAGAAAVDEAASIFRTHPGGVSGLHQLGLLGETLWEAGRTEQAIGLVTECIQLVEAGGAIQLGAAFRLLLAEMLCYEGRVAHAACVLPPRDRIQPEARCGYYHRRGAIRRSGGKLPEAIADFAALVAICEERPEEQIPLAEARARLAGALAEAGDVERAEVLAQQAQETLAAAGHPAFAWTCITHAVAGWRRDGSPGEHVEAAVRWWKDAPFLLPAEKARELESAAKSLESVGLDKAASECRAEAVRWWDGLKAAAMVG